MDRQIEEILNRFTAIFVEELEDSLTGIYLHGSLAMGCFNPAGSDIDILVVIRDNLPHASAAKIARKLVILREEMANGLEISVVREAALAPVTYPTPCELHFSDYHLERYRADEDYVCGGYEDEDLASQIAVAYYRGRTLYGEPLAKCYPAVGHSAYLSSILHDIADAATDILENPMYMTLNLCRVLYYIQEGQIASKREGGEWGIASLPSEFRELVQVLLDQYNGVPDIRQVEPGELTTFAGYMLDEIDKKKREEGRPC
ncbi:aminoglycoside adenylyltransferase domain-containing protein [Paenibacillus sp. sgz5001063]|uniref:aminoglycoside adenylyltransferase domain-containing protein n=1 Tax=Paenibacillus sp. sgz5001063 TaxID=3242474 RepID=UPI0036D29BF8